MEFSWLNLFLVVLVSWFSGALVMRLGYPHVLGELLGGIIFGPPLLGWIRGDAGIVLLGRVGILMMVLFIGTRVDPKDLVKSAGGALLPTFGGFFVPFILGYFAVTHMLGGNTNAALVVGIVMGTTALVTTSRFVTDLNLLNTRLGQTLMAVSLLSIIVVLVFFSAILGIVDSGGVKLGAIALVLGKALAFLVLIVLLGIYVFPLLGKLHEKVERHPGSTDELTVAILFAVGVAFVAEMFGLSFILGAFLAGLFLREEMFEKDTFANVLSAVRDAALGFLAPIFYVSAGFMVSFSALRNPALVTTVIVVSLLGKFLGGLVFSMLAGRKWREATVIGVGMNARGSIDIIVAGVALQKGIISRDIYTALILSMFLANVVVPVLLRAGRDWLDRRGELARVAVEPPEVAPQGAAPATA
jgi:Kef-type K+ transport system membrane component KefB